MSNKQECIIEAGNIFDEKEMEEVCGKLIYHFWAKQGHDTMGDWPMNSNYKTKGCTYNKIKGIKEVAVINYHAIDLIDEEKIIISDKIAWVDIFTRTQKDQLMYRGYRNEQ